MDYTIMEYLVQWPPGTGMPVDPDAGDGGDLVAAATIPPPGPSAHYDMVASFIPLGRVGG